MIWSDIGAIGSFAGSLVAAIGLLLIYSQVYHIKRQIKGSASASLYEQMIDIDRYFVDHPELKTYIYGNNLIEKDDKQYDRIRSLAEMMCDLMEHAFVQKDNLPLDVWPRWKDYMQYLYDSSPIIRQHLHESGAWYTENILYEIERTSRLPNNQPPMETPAKTFVKKRGRKPLNKKK